MARSKLTLDQKLSFNSNGFTLIELIVVTTLSVVLLLTTTAMLITIIEGNTRTTVRKALDDQGDEALSQMSFFLKNAINLLDNAEGLTCQENMQSIKVLTTNDDTVQFRQSNNQLVVDKNGITSPMTDDNLNITANLDIDCFENDNGEKYADVSFTLEKEITAGFGENEVLSEEFRTLVQFRNL